MKHASSRAPDLLHGPVFSNMTRFFLPIMLGSLLQQLYSMVDAVVLGCTHYSFLRGAIRRIVGRTPEIIDGSYGIAMQLRRRLEAADGLNESGVRGTVTFENSLDEPEILALSRALLDYEEEE